MSSSSSVGVKSDKIEMLNVGEDGVPVGTLTKVSGKDSTSYRVEGGSTACEMEADIYRDRSEILGNENDGCFNFCREFGGHRVLLFSFRDIPLRFLLPALQPCSMDFAKFLVYGLGHNAVHRSENHTVHSTSLYPVPYFSR